MKIASAIVLIILIVALYVILANEDYGDNEDEKYYVNGRFDPELYDCSRCCFDMGDYCRLYSCYLGKSQYNKQQNYGP